MHAVSQEVVHGCVCLPKTLSHRTAGVSRHTGGGETSWGKEKRKTGEERCVDRSQLSYLAGTNHVDSDQKRVNPLCDQTFRVRKCSVESFTYCLVMDRIMIPFITL